MTHVINPRLQQLDRRSIPQLVLAWVLLLPLLYLAVHGRPSFQHVGIGVDDEISISAHVIGAPEPPKDFVHYSIYLAYAVILCVCLKQMRRIGREMWLSQPVVWLAMLTMVSALWSQMPVESLRSGYYYLLDTLFAFYLVVTFTTEELMTLTMMLGTVVALGTVVVVTLFPQYGLVHQLAHAGVWRGIFSEKNDAAKNLVFLIAPVINRRILRPANLAYAIAIFGLIAMTRSATAMVILFSYVLFMAVLQLYKRMNARNASFSLLLAATLFVVVATVGYFEFPVISALLGRDPTLTGRTDIWAPLIESARKRPLLGYGYSAFWTGLQGESGTLYMQLGWFFTYAHSGVLEILLQLGLAGLVVAGIALWQAVRNALLCVRRNGDVGTDWLAGLIFLTLAYNLDEGTILFTHSLVSVFFVLACIGLSRKARASGRVLAMRPVAQAVAVSGSVRVA
jgi:O-antigen ligase